MTRARLAALAALVPALACTNPESPPAGVRFRQPAGVAVFFGRTIGAPAEVRPHLAVANAARNDLSILDAVTNQPVPSPIQLQTLVYPVADRPQILLAARLGDDQGDVRKPDLLVAVSAGDSVIQVVETWSTAGTVHADPGEAPAPLAVDLGFDVLALAPMPSRPGTARLAAALASRRVAVVEYERVGEESIRLVPGSLAVRELPFQPEAIAAMPDDPADGPETVQTALYVASLDPVCAPDPGDPSACAEPAVPGVAELSADLATVRALGARAPTRLVAAARLKERQDLSAASDGAAFAGQPLVPRVYAVLDESGCGPRRPVACGVAVLDPDPATPSGAQAIRADYDGRMPYLAPLAVPGRPLALAISGPPAVPPPAVEGEPAYDADLMRLYMGNVARATTAVAAVASDDGRVYFLDLGRFESATKDPVVAGTSVTVLPADYLDDKTTVNKTPPDDRNVEDARRLWFQDENGAFAADEKAAAKLVKVTPGFTPDELLWSVSYQGALPGLENKTGEAGQFAQDRPWLALQVGQDLGGGGRFLSEVVKLWHPGFAVKRGDLVVFRAKDVPGCTGTDPVGSPPDAPDDPKAENEFELEIDDLLPPAEAYPGGAVSFVPVPPPAPEAGTARYDCYQALVAATSDAKIATGLTVTIRARGLLLFTSRTLGGYAGRPVLDVAFTLAYPQGEPGEDALALACPVADWDGDLVTAPACDAACRTACETLVLARKVRRIQNVSVSCATDATRTEACNTRWPNNAFPAVPGTTALDFRLGLQKGEEQGDPGTGGLGRDLGVVMQTASGAGLRYSTRGTPASPFGATGAIPFDRSGYGDPVIGYRFYVSYPSDFVLDTTPGQVGAPFVVVR